MKFLDVDKEILDTKGAVSPEVAKQMAEGVRKAVGSDIWCRHNWYSRSYWRNR